MNRKVCSLMGYLRSNHMSWDISIESLVIGHAGLIRTHGWWLWKCHFQWKAGFFCSTGWFLHVRHAHIHTHTIMKRVSGRLAIAWNEKHWRKELNRGTTERAGAWSKEAERVEWWIDGCDGCDSYLLTRLFGLTYRWWKKSAYSCGILKTR